MSVRILLADDHTETRQAIRTLLAARPDWLICGEADNGLDAVEKAATLKPDLVILDLSMPKMNGLEAAKVIHTASPSLLLLLFSVDGRDLRTLSDIRAAGFRGIVSKANAWLLPEAIEMVLEGKTFINGSALATATLVEAEAAPSSAEQPQGAKTAAAGADDSSEKPPIA
jgi:DNA-binding NarL/FixJ family response regulator